jgi:type II secretory pathway predicted ATPase ExeA
MYETFFEMKQTPFSSQIPTKSLYLSSMLDETLSRLEYASSRQLFAVVTSDVGCGKTTALRRLSETLPSREYELLYLSDSKLTPRWFYKGLLDQLGVVDRLH